MNVSRLGWDAATLGERREWVREKERKKGGRLNINCFLREKKIIFQFPGIPVGLVRCKGMH